MNQRSIVNFLLMAALAVATSAAWGDSPAEEGNKPSGAAAALSQAEGSKDEAAPKKFVLDQRPFKVDKATKEIQISRIFEWYGPKFTKDPKRPAKAAELFLIPWVTAEFRQILESGDYKLKIIEWNWTLNERLAK